MLYPRLSLHVISDINKEECTLPATDIARTGSMTVVNTKCYVACTEVSRIWSSERGDTDKSGLSRALHPIEAQEERRRILGIGIPLSMRLQSLEDEGYAVLRLVIQYLGHSANCTGAQEPHHPMLLGLDSLDTHSTLRVRCWWTDWHMYTCSM